MVGQGDGTPSEKRKISAGLALVPIVAMALLLAIGYGRFGIKAQVLLVAAAVVAGVVGRFAGYSWDEMQQGIVESTRKAMPAILIMLSVGMLIGAWITCGTIPMLMAWGLRLISAKVFLVTASLVCVVVALATGTSWGTVGTVGVALIGIAEAQGVPAGPAAGAIVAGAYLGDKLSPFSDIPNLAPIAAGSNLYDTIRHCLWSALPAFAFGLGVYFVVGQRYTVTADASQVTRLIGTLEGAFRFHVLLLLPMLVVFAFAILKKPVIPGMVLSVAIALALAVWLQGRSVGELATALNTGFKPATGVAEVDRLLARGGLMSMMETQLIAFAAFAFGGIMQRTGMLTVLLERVARVAARTWSLVATTVAAALGTAMVTGSSYLSILIPGELLAPLYRERNLAAKNLARIVVEAGGIMVPLIPWSMAGVYVAGTLGVPTLTYLPWAIMNYASVVLLLIFGATGFTMARRVADDETRPGS